MKVLLVDDEKHALQLFRGVLGLFENTIEIVGEALNLEEAVSLINEKKPSVVFLDIDMPRLSGLRIVDYIADNRDFEVVFVTAHSSYAIEAIRIRAFDYLLKPVDKDSLKECYHRLVKKIALLEAPKSKNEKVMLLTQKGITSIEMNKIIYLEADSVYCKIFLEDGNHHVISKPLGEFITQLNQDFIRVHRSYAVNKAFIESIRTSHPNKIILKNGIQIPLSRANKAEVICGMKDS